MNSEKENPKNKSSLMTTGNFNTDIKDINIEDSERDDIVLSDDNNVTNTGTTNKVKGKSSDVKIINEEKDSSYVATLKNYHPPGGRKIEPSKSEDLEWQSNSKVAKNINSEDKKDKVEEKKEDPDKNTDEYSRFKNDKKGFGADFDSDFFWQT